MASSIIVLLFDVHAAIDLSLRLDLLCVALIVLRKLVVEVLGKKANEVNNSLAKTANSDVRWRDLRQ